MRRIRRASTISVVAMIARLSRDCAFKEYKNKEIKVKDMLDILNETFLQQYFLYCAILGKYCNRKELFDYVADLFFIPNNQKEYLFALSEEEPVSDIETYGDAMRYSRVRQYCELNEYTLIYDDAQKMVSVKSKAIKHAVNNNLYADRNATQSQIYKALLDGALAGNIVAMRLLGTLQCEGIFVEKQLEFGLKNLYRAGQWADMVSLLTVARYLQDDKYALAQNFNRLSAVVENTQYAELCNKLQQSYGIYATKPSEEIQLLKKAFAANRVKADVYQPLCGRLIFSNAIDIKDKEKILFSDNKSLLSEVCDLPLKLTYNNLSLAVDALDEMPLKREQEQRKLKTELLNFDLREHDGYRPLCLVSDDEYALETYVKAITAMLQPQTDHLERIDVADLKLYDFEPTANNVYIRSCSDGQNNVFLLTLKGDIDSAILQHVTHFLASSKRRRFRLNSPRVTLNLSPILPICISDQANASKLGDSVECIYIADITAEEKMSIVSVMLASKSKLYLTKAITAEKDVIRLLCNCSPVAIERVLDKLFSENRFNSKFDEITADLIKPYEKVLNTHSQKAYGFGGYVK